VTGSDPFGTYHQVGEKTLSLVFSFSVFFARTQTEAAAEGGVFVWSSRGLVLLLCLKQNRMRAGEDIEKEYLTGRDIW
jgi:hypothetical protein